MNKLTRNEQLLLGVVIVYNLTLFIFSSLWIFTGSFPSLKSTLVDLTELQVNEKVTYTMFFAGALGGSFYCLRGIYQHLADAAKPEPTVRFDIMTWFFWYLFRPLQSGVLALITLCLVKSDLMSGQKLTGDNLKSYYTLIAVGFLVGVGTHQVMQKIEELISVLFAKAQLKEKNPKED
ncbi:hypothetical protein [Flavobacterium sp. 3HN19-14]|uniref:hypothetical protein n=1 Tax=Flavobacterium sp. 3HN19-14 TaxID=3448133 RepID=UPI003EDFC6C8